MNLDLAGLTPYDSSRAVAAGTPMKLAGTAPTEGLSCSRRRALICDKDV